MALKGCAKYGPFGIITSRAKPFFLNLTVIFFLLLPFRFSQLPSFRDNQEEVNNQHYFIFFIFIS